MGQQPGKGRQSYRCAYSLNPPPHPTCLSASAGSRSASGFPLAPALELGISKIQLHRPIAAGAFLLGLPEGGTSEWEEGPPSGKRSLHALLSMGQVWYRLAASLLSLVGVNGPGSVTILTCWSWVVLPKIQETRRKVGRLGLSISVV